MQKTILIVDDEKEIRDTLGEYFEILNNYKTFRAANGKEALELLSKNEADMVISDIRMPDGDGIFLANELKEKISKGLKLIFMTGYTDLTRDDAIKLGANEVFYKPFDAPAMNKYIVELFKEG